MDDWKTAFFVLLASATLAGEPVITCEPRDLRGVPGEPLRAELTVETDRAVPIQLRIPAVSNLVLYTVEKIPIRRSDDGRFIQKRIVIWQGTEAGYATITNLTVIFQGLKKTDDQVPDIGKNKPPLTQSVPGIGITIDPVEPAKPPAKEEPK